MNNSRYQEFQNSLVFAKADVENEIGRWEKLLKERENKVSKLLVQIQDLKIKLNLFEREYNAKVGIFYVELDKLNLQIKEYQRRIDLIRKKKPCVDALQDIEDDIRDTFSSERKKVDDLEEETSESTRSYEENLRKKEEKPADEELEQKLKSLWRKLALKYHPDRAKDENQRKEFHSIMAAINEAYENKDFELLKKYAEKAEREEKILKETPQEKLERLKSEYDLLARVLAEKRDELNALKRSETYKLKKQVESALKEGTDLLERKAIDLRKQIEQLRLKLDELIVEYKKTAQAVMN